MEEKIRKILDLRFKIEALETQMKELQDEVKEEIRDKVVMDGYVISKRNKTTYTLKKEVSADVIAKEYPELASIKIDAKELYRCANNPDSLVDVKSTTYLEVREDKANGNDIDI